MKKFCSYSVVLIFSIIPVFLQAQLSVSYQAFQPDDIVIGVGQWKMTAKQLGKYGFESFKATITNEDVSEQLFTSDRLPIAGDEIYKRLKYSLPITGAKWLSLSFLIVNGIFPLGVYLGDRELFKQVDTMLATPDVDMITLGTFAKKIL